MYIKLYITLHVSLNDLSPIETYAEQSVYYI